MGLIRMGPPEELVLYLAQLMKINSFVETGTYYGHTSAWASEHFEYVYTIELSEILYQQASRAHASNTKISFHLGDSRSLLPAICEKVFGRGIFWLDAHYCSGSTAGSGSKAPLLEEIAIVNQYAKNSCILIDDARLILLPPPAPHPIDEYPDISEVLVQLNELHPRYNVVFEDVIISVPHALREPVAMFLQKRVTDLDREYWKNHDMTEFERARRHLYRGYCGWKKQISRRLSKVL